jgi:hypothetical protein
MRRNLGVELEASAGRQIEGFLDVGHFAFVHVETFGDRTNPEVPTYEVTPTANGFQADYLSTVSNYPKHLKHLNPPGFKWRRLFDFFCPSQRNYQSFFRRMVDCIFSTQRVQSRLGKRVCLCLSAAISIRMRRCRTRSILITKSSRRIK